MNQKFDVIVYGDFLDEMTSQSENMTEVIDVLYQRGLLGRVICRDAKRNKLYVRAIPGGAFFIKIFTFLELKTGYNFRDFCQNSLFDFFAAKKIRSEFVIASVSGLRECLLATKRRGGVYIEMALMENPEVFSEKLVKELTDHKLIIQEGTRSFLNNLSRTLRGADYIIAISHFVKKSFVQRGYDDRKIIVSDLGINEDVYFPVAYDKYKQKKFKVLYLAHTQVLKGLQYLLQAWQYLQDYDMELIVVGLIDKNTEKIIQKYKNLQGVFFVGAEKHIIGRYQQADLFVFPTLSDGLGKAALEAMACGVPVIITDQCGVEITDGIEGFIVDAGDPVLLENKIRFCYEHRDMTKEMGLAARETFLKKYSSERYRSNLTEIIDKILSYETIEK